MELILILVVGVPLGFFLPDRKIARRCGEAAALGLVSLLVVVAVPTAKASVLTENLPPLPVDVAAAVQPAEPFLEESSGSLPTLPANPVASPVGAVKRPLWAWSRS